MNSIPRPPPTNRTRPTLPPPGLPCRQPSSTWIFAASTHPSNGQVSRERITVGNLIQPSGGLEGILTTVVSIDPFYAYQNVDENRIHNYIKLHAEGKLKTARDAIVPIYLGLQNEEGFPHDGYIDVVDNCIDPDTGTMRVRGVFRTWDSLLTPSFFVRPRAAASPTSNALLLPHESAESRRSSCP